MKAHAGALDISDLTKLRRRRQGERQKSIRFNEQNNNSTRASRFFPSLPLHNYDVKWPNFKFTWERERQGDEFYHLHSLSELGRRRLSSAPTKIPFF